MTENEIFINAITPLDKSSSEKNDTNIENKIDDWKDENTRK